MAVLLDGTVLLLRTMQTSHLQVTQLHPLHHTYLFTPWCRVLLEKLTGLQLVKKFPAFYGTRRFITALTSVRQLSLSWASPIQSIYPHPTSCRSIRTLSTHLRLGLTNGVFPSSFPTHNCLLIFAMEVKQFLRYSRIYVIQLLYLMMTYW